MKMHIGIILVSLALLTGCAKKDADPEASNEEPKQEVPVAAEPEAPAATTPKVVITQPYDASKALKPKKVGDEASPLVQLTWIKGEPVTISPGNVYVVEFWATWCPPCRTSIPHLTELQKKYKDRIVFVGVSDEDVAKVTPFVEGMGEKMDYAVAVDAAGAVTREYMKAFGQNGIPHAFIVSAAGKIVWHGHPMDAQFEPALERTLSTPGQG